MNEPTEAELDRLEPEEFVRGYRLACQAKVIAEGHVKVSNVPYFREFSSRMVLMKICNYH